MDLFGLIGFPLGHSFSVSYFSKKFSEGKIDAEYRNFPLEDLSQFEGLVKNEPRLVGLNVTVPYKQKILPYLDALDRTSRTIRAVNTIRFCKKGNHLALLGFNTDVTGFERSLKEHLKPDHQRALVLGTGGSSRAVGYVLENLGIEFKMVSRSKGEDVMTYEVLEQALVTEHTLIINTTPLGMQPNVDDCPTIPYEAITSKHLLFDLIYNPEKTLFLSRGEAQGATIVNGYNMLVYQAEASWDIWNKPA